MAKEDENSIQRRPTVRNLILFGRLASSEAVPDGN